MTELRADFLFDVRGLLVRSELVGASYNVKRDGKDCRITLPAADSDLGIPPEVIKLRAIGGWLGDPPSAYILDLVKVSVHTDEPVSASDFDDPNLRVPASKLCLDRVLPECAGIARAILRDYLELVRVVGKQHWLGTSASEPRIEFSGHLLDLEAGRRLPVGHTDPIGRGVILHKLEDALDSSLNDHLLTDVIDQRGPPLPEAMLMDAKYLSWTRRPPNPREALLLAAIACEVKIKEVLRRAARPEVRNVLDLVLENPRDVSMPVATLFDKTAKAVIGLSMREDDKSLFKALVRLFEVRNAIAHRGGEGVHASEMSDGVGTAVRAFDWLSRVERMPRSVS